MNVLNHKLNMVTSIKFCLVFWFTTTLALPDCFKPKKLVYQRPGNITITGILNSKGGEHCNEVIGRGLTEMASAAWVVAALNRLEYVPGLQIGLSLFEGCSDPELAQRALIQAVFDSNCHSLDTADTGILATADISTPLITLGDSLNKTITRIAEVIDDDTLVDMTLTLVSNLHTSVIHRVIVENVDLLTKISSKAAREGICIYEELLTADVWAISSEISLPNTTLYDSRATESTDQPFIVIMTSSLSMQHLIPLMKDLFNDTEITWIFAPLDSHFNFSIELPTNSMVLLPLTSNLEVLQDFLQDEKVSDDFLNHREPMKSPLFLKMASSILQIVQPYKELQKELCPNDIFTNEACPALEDAIRDIKTGYRVINQPKQVSFSIKDLPQILETLKIETVENDEMLLYIVSKIKHGSAEDKGIFQVFDPQNDEIEPKLLILNDEESKGGRYKRVNREIFKLDEEYIKQLKLKNQNKNVTKTEEEKEAEITMDKEEITKEQKTADTKHPCTNILNKNLDQEKIKECGMCQNLIKYSANIVTTVSEKHLNQNDNYEHIKWKSDVWVSVNVSIATIGTICCIAVAIFIIVRICKGDILEGNPFFSFLLITSLIFMYMTTLLFSFDIKDPNQMFLSSVICDLKKFSIPVSYTFLFSTLLARSLMLASCDQDGGFMSHINGYIQATLIFFIFVAQLTPSIQFFLLNPSFHSVENDLNCQELHEKHFLIIMLSYNMFLLLLLAAICPFIFRCKRNYKEGRFFTIAISLTVIVWSTWITCYFLVSDVSKDGAVVLGLSSTASVVLVSIFIPRTHLMMSAVIRDRLANTLPVLNSGSQPTIQDLQYKSTQALYDSIQVQTNSPRYGLPNPNFYTIEPADEDCHTNGSNQFYSSNLRSSLKTNNASGSSKRKFLGDRLKQVSPENTYEAYDTPPSPRRMTQF